MKARTFWSFTQMSALTVHYAEPECPAEAIFAEDEVPDDMQEYIEINKDLADIWPNISEKKDPLPDAEEWDGVANKLQYLER